jgi:transcriptional regulator with XRE-family HTH domain
MCFQNAQGDLPMPQKPASRAIPNHRLRQARLERGWSQAEVADKLSDQTKELYVHTSQVSRWESGVLRPGTFYQQKLSQLFGKAREELGIVAEPPAGLSMFLLDPIIPQRLRPIIGREQLLRSLKRRLCLKEPMFFTALSGLPGVGKTALAVELAHDPEIHQYFPDGVLWADVGPHPSRREVQSRWARLLGLRATETRAWRTDEDWAMAIRHARGVRRMLLVIDDVWGIEDALALELGGPFCAHLLTSRSSIIATHLGNEQVVRVPSLKEEDGVRLLAQFAPQVIEAEPEEVRSLVHEVGGLPLALRLIGGYLSAQTYHKGFSAIPAFPQEQRSL